VDGETV